MSVAFKPLHWRSDMEPCVDVGISFRRRSDNRSLFFLPSSRVICRNTTMGLEVPLPSDLKYPLGFNTDIVLRATLCLIKVRCNCFHPISWIISCDSFLGVESLLVPIFHSWQFLFHRRWPSVASSDTSPHSPTVGWALEITRHRSYQVRIVFSQISWLT